MIDASCVLLLVGVGKDTAKMEIMHDVFALAKGLPHWQQVIVKGVLESDNFDNKKIREIADLAIKNEKHDISILDEIPVSGTTAVTNSVSLVGIRELSNINNLVEGGGVDFASTGLTVIYGENGAGKSGYSRILKKCCRSRDKNCEILENVYSKSDTPQSAKLLFNDGACQEFLWQPKPKPKTPPAELSKVHVFDRLSAEVYLGGENAIEYRPSGMDILDKLIFIIQEVKKEVEASQLALKFNVFNWTSQYGTTKATALVSQLEAKNPHEELDKLIVFTQGEDAELKKLQEDIPVREKSSPQKDREKLIARNGSLKKVALYIETLVSICSAENIKQANDAINELKAAEKNANDAKKLSFDNDNFLSGTGNEAWKLMWESAKKFSEEFAYAGQEYPPKNSDSGIRCVLCQRELEDKQISLMDRFSKYVLDESQEVLKKKQSVIVRLVQDLNSKLKKDDDEATLIDSIKTEYPTIHAELSGEMSSVRNAILEIIKKIEEGESVHAETVNVSALTSKLTASNSEIKNNQAKISEPLDDAKYMEDLENDRQKLAEFLSRKDLLRDKVLVLQNIESHKKSKELDKAIRQCSTTGISRKMGELNKTYIVDALADEFDKEVREITRGRVGAKLLPTRIRQGVQLSRIVLTLGDGTSCQTDLTKILSDGELRGASIAGFMAELSMADDKSAIIFDDPISSLDHVYSKAVAERICREAQKRQVIIFTHDMLFLTQLVNLSGKTVPITLKTIRSGMQAGVVENELPPEKMKLKDRIGRLKEMIQSEIKPLYKSNELANYQEKGRQFYRELRQSWERFVEEVLFCNVITRFDCAVHTQQLRDVTIEDSDISIINAGMSECSKYLHDQPNVMRTDIENPEVLEKDLENLTNLQKSIRDRRKNKSKPKQFEVDPKELKSKNFHFEVVSAKK